MSSWLRFVCASLALTAFACHHGSDSENPLEPDAGAEPPVDLSLDDPSIAPVEDAGTPGIDDASTVAVAVDAAPDAGPAGSSWRGGDSFETARTIEPNGLPFLIDERSADQVDYFAFHGEAGKFYELKTDRTSFSPNNVMAVFDGARAALAENDDGFMWFGDGIDARLLVHIAKSGTYFVRIEDLDTPQDFFGSEFSLLYFHLTIREITATTKGFAIAEAGGPTPAAFEHDAKTGYDYVTVLGKVRAPDEVFTFQGQAGKALIGHVGPGGPKGDGSSLSKGRVRISADDAGVLAEIDRASGQTDIHPPINAGACTLSVHTAGSALGDNPYYAVDLVQLGENPREQAEAANNLISGAEPVTFSGKVARRGLVLARLPPNDVDYYQFDLKAGDLVRASCEGESAGSGVRALHAELRDQKDAKIESAEETTLDNLAVAQVQVDTAGTYYLRLSATRQALTPPVEPWARCVLMINR